MAAIGGRKSDAVGLQGLTIQTGLDTLAPARGHVGQKLGHRPTHDVLTDEPKLLAPSRAGVHQPQIAVRHGHGDGRGGHHVEQELFGGVGFGPRPILAAGGIETLGRRSHSIGQIRQNLRQRLITGPRRRKNGQTAPETLCGEAHRGAGRQISAHKAQLGVPPFRNRPEGLGEQLLCAGVQHQLQDAIFPATERIIPVMQNDFDGIGGEMRPGRLRHPPKGRAQGFGVELWSDTAAPKLHSSKHSELTQNPSGRDST